MSKSEIYFENLFSPEEIDPVGDYFIEIFEGLKWYEDLPTSNKKQGGGEVSYADVYFRVASKTQMYSLDPYKILDLLGDLGGLLELFKAFGMIFTASIVKKAFDISLLSDTYQV